VEPLQAWRAKGSCAGSKWHAEPQRTQSEGAAAPAFPPIPFTNYFSLKLPAGKKRYIPICRLTPAVKHQNNFKEP